VQEAAIASAVAHLDAGPQSRTHDSKLARYAAVVQTATYPTGGGGGGGVDTMGAAAPGERRQWAVTGGLIGAAMNVDRSDYC
jgi:hypothetical protein